MGKIVIDPGHGGAVSVGASSANNAKGPKGTLEKDMTLKLAAKTAEILNQNQHDVKLTRSKDENLGLAARAKVAADFNADVFLSIHFNGNADPSIQGTEAWVHPAASADSKLLGSSVLQRLVQVGGYKNRGLRSAKWGVLSPEVHNANTAACLAEISFLSDPHEEDRLVTPAYQDQICAHLAQAIMDFLNKSTAIQVVVPKPGVLPAIDGDG